MTCAVVGDSIALMIAPFLDRCVVDAKVGEHVAQIVGRVHDADVVIVSAGSNDADYNDLAANLEKVRARCSHRVLWILPALDRPRRLGVQQAGEATMNGSLERKTRLSR